MEEFLRSLGLTENEIKVYLALLKLKKGTKTPIVRESKVLSSKVYEVLDKLIRKGFVSSFVEGNVTQFVPVHPINIAAVFDDKIQRLEKQKKQFEERLKSSFYTQDESSTDVQVFRNWDGLRSVFNILFNDLKKGDTYYILGSNAGEDFEKAFKFFPKIVSTFDTKGIKRKVIHRLEKKHEAESYFKAHGKKNWNIRYYPTIGPLEIGITNNYVMLNLLEKEPIVTLIHNKKVRDSFLSYFNSIWKLAL